MKIDVTDFSLDDEDRGLGIFYNEQHVYYRRKTLKGKLNYRFRLKLSRHRDCFETLKAMQNEEYDRDWDRNIESEIIEFYHTLDLKTLTKKKSNDIDRILLNEFVQKVQPKLYNKLVKRIERKYLKKIPKPIIYEPDPNTNTYGAGGIFLHFEKESSYIWAGPFQYKNKEGALAFLREQEYRPFRFRDVESEYQSYHIPYKIQNKYNLEPNDIHYWTPERKREFFNSLSIREKHSIIQSIVAYYDKESIESTLPYKIYLMGNDDTSYSKWFASEEERKEEFDYLLMMQPLDFLRDISQRGYIFTN